MIEFDSSEQYFNTDALSQSKIKALLTGMGTYRTVDPDAEDAEHFILGSAVDCKLLTPSLFNREYYKSTLTKKPSPLIMSILRLAYASRVADIIEENKHVIWRACNEKEYYLNRAKEFDKDNRPDDIIKKGKLYWDELMNANGKTILDDNELSIVNKIVETYRQHEHTRNYFVEEDGKFFLTQYPIYFTYKNIDCKALLDLIIVDTNLKTIQIIDIKTMGENTKMFPRNAKRRRYDIQAAWYTHAVEQHGIIRANEYLGFNLSEYKMLPFKFIVESTTSAGYCPLVYTCTPIDMSVGRYGAQSKSQILKSGDNTIVPIREIHGFEHGVNLYEWHHEEQQWNYDRYIAESKGELPLQIWET